jgi:FtsH-binding integral membrane protein
MQPIPLRRTQVQAQVNGFIRSVYNWMAIGLGITALVAFYVSNNESLQRIVFGNRLLFFVCSSVSWPWFFPSAQECTRCSLQAQPAFLCFTRH